MKRRIFTIINLILFIILLLFDINFIDKYWMKDADAIMCFMLGLTFFMLWLFGNLFPNKTVKFVYKLAMIMYKHSELEFPCFIEAKRIFHKRLPYFLLVTNVCLFAIAVDNF